MVSLPVPPGSSLWPPGSPEQPPPGRQDPGGPLAAAWGVQRGSSQPLAQRSAKFPKGWPGWPGWEGLHLPTPQPSPVSSRAQPRQQQGPSPSAAGPSPPRQRGPGPLGSRARRPRQQGPGRQQPLSSRGPAPSTPLPFGDGDHVEGCLGGRSGGSWPGARSPGDRTWTCSREADPW